MTLESAKAFGNKLISGGLQNIMEAATGAEEDGVDVDKAGMMEVNP